MPHKQTPAAGEWWDSYRKDKMETEMKERNEGLEQKDGKSDSFTREKAEWVV